LKPNFFTRYSFLRLIMLFAAAAFLAACAAETIDSTQSAPATALPLPFATSQVASPPPPAITVQTPVTAAVTPVPTATPIPNPIAIEFMRRQNYPGSDIVIEQNLASGSNYRRYIASYMSEGLRIYALLTIPFNRKPETGYPVIVFNHGYIPPREYRTTQRYVAYVDALASNGYIVLRPDYRGHDKSEGQPANPYTSPAYTIDVLNAVASIKRHPDADPNRIGMWGHSMGGQITLRNMVINQDVKAGVIWAGVVASYPDLFHNWRRKTPSTTPTPIVRRHFAENLAASNGSPEENPLFWASISPNSYLKDLSGPIQLHHGSDDKDVPVEFSEMLYSEILAAGKSAEVYIYKGDNHNISTNFATAMQRTLSFFDRYVKQIPTPS